MPHLPTEAMSSARRRFFALLIVLLLCLTASASAQDSKVPANAQAVTLETDDMHSIAGWFYAPKVKGSPALILLHMRGSDKSAFRVLADKLVAEGYAVIAIDLRGHGESVFPDGSRPGVAALTQTDYQSMLYDAKAAHDFLATQESVDADRVGIIGASIGANLAMIYAATDRRVRTVVALSCGENYRGLQPGQYMKEFGRRPLYLICARGDEASWQSSVALEKLAIRADPVSLRIFAGAAHGTELLSAQEGLDDTIVSGWLLNYLPPRR